jgi:hypothetical protein
MMFFPIHSLLGGSRKGSYNVPENVQKWYERVMSREACKKGLARLQQEEETQFAKAKF